VPGAFQYPWRSQTTGDEGVTTVARHAASPTPRASSRAASVVPAADTEPGRSGRSVAAGGVVAVAGVALAALTVGAIAASGVSLLPRGQAATSSPPSTAPPVERAALTTTPAQVAITKVVSNAPAPTWAPAGTATWTAATPFDEQCGRPVGLDASIAAARAYTVGEDQVLVSVSAYSAGQGAPALAAWSSSLGGCSSSGRVGRVRVDGPGGSGIAAWLRGASGTPQAAMLMWRRGDVLALVAVPIASPARLAERAAVVDTALLAALVGRCADTSSTRSDAARSPWVARGEFTGLTEPLTVAVEASPTPVPPPDVVAVPPSWTATPLPSVSIPARPVDPVWPADLPAPVAVPVAPRRPAPAPVSTAVPSRVDDPVGPGCGWKFTGQVPPTYDVANETALTAQRAAQAEADLAALQAQWQSDTVTFWRDVPAYEQQAALFAAYADSVDAVATSWDTITRQRERYAAAVEVYNAAVAARTEFFAAQALARAQYEQEVALCGSTPTPLPSTSPPIDPTAVPTPTPSATPTPSPTDAVAAGCPPQVPSILFEVPPDLPPVPTPPADPRPAPTATR
jgi:predicted RecA/RadA family phage recombinase